MSLETFIAEWCWPGPYRSVGTPEQARFTHYEAVDRLAALIGVGAAPVYVSANPYNEAGEIEVITRLFFDFDSKSKVRLAWDDAQAFNEALARHYGIGALTCFSGKKGYHVHVWLQQPMEGPPEHMAGLYKQLRAMLTRGARYATLDPQAADIKRLTRLPYSKHQDTGELCVPVDQDMKPYTLPSGFSLTLAERGVEPALVKIAERQLYTAQPRQREYSGPKGRIRPCMEAVLAARSVHDPAHTLKVAAVAELAAEGYDTEEIVSRFSRMEGFDEEKTRYFVGHALRRGYRPYKCSTIREMGGCVPTCPKHHPGEAPARAGIEEVSA